MMEFKELLMDIRKELRCADDYAKEAHKHKDEYPELSAVYHRIANDKLAHADLLATQAKRIAEHHKMTDLWEIEWWMIRNDNSEVKHCLEEYHK